MPAIDVNIDTAARAAYLEVYKAAAITAVNAHMAEVIRGNFATNGFVELVYQHRAVQAFAWLADADRDANIARYPLIESGLGPYGATRQEVAEAYIGYNNVISYMVVKLYEDHFTTVHSEIPWKTEKQDIDAAVSDFRRRNPL